MHGETTSACESSASKSIASASGFKSSPPSLAFAQDLSYPTISLSACLPLSRRALFSPASPKPPTVLPQSPRRHATECGHVQRWCRCRCGRLARRCTTTLRVSASRPRPGNSLEPELYTLLARFRWSCRMRQRWHKKLLQLATTSAALRAGRLKNDSACCYVFLPRGYRTVGPLLLHQSGAESSNV